MFARITGRGLVLSAILGLALALGGCSKSLSGKYVDQMGTTSIEFKGGKAIMNSQLLGMKDSETADYTVEGDTITIKSKKNGDMTFTMMKDGSIKGALMTFTKTSG